jgi:hypothetical protein
MKAKNQPGFIALDQSAMSPVCHPIVTSAPCDPAMRLKGARINTKW